ncbi:MAG TPA: hypothetical protein VGL59_19070 [Polyangia bacterium]|jgi:hypothetical protein
MSISSVSSSTISGITPFDPQTTPTTASGSTDDVAGVTVDISKPGQLFSQLSSLASSDPDKFKTVTADIAQKLKDAAGSQTGKQADFLNQLADKFGAASQSGSASDLPAPRAHGHHGGGHHHHAQAASGSSDSAGQSGSSAAGGPGGVFQTVESIISNALEGTST